MNWKKIEKEFDEKFEHSQTCIYGNILETEEDCICRLGNIKSFYREKFKEMEEELVSLKLLWDRMGEWQEEWRNEYPEKRKLMMQDSLRLIEWKIGGAYNDGVKDEIKNCKIENR